MDDLYEVLKLWHIISFVFMSIPLFNLIVVNERALMGSSFNYGTDTFMENIIRNGAIRCYVFQLSVFISGILLLVFGHWGIQALWLNYILLAKTVLLFILMSLLSYVHFSLQPKIDSFFKDITPETKVPDNFLAPVKPFRVLRKRLATICLFLVLTTIILGMQTYSPFSLTLNLILIGLAGLFAWRVNKTLILFGWL
ncbi:MAG: hypothetical protein KAQ79_06310 [Cyclobacteriaceae bacterium]|nr:hypothetical protein [Cyclobacteriaceae bacterium]